ncbi:MAG: Eco57I restriction-modification methylase domain-containing protein [ANME-2 cluster archaeon]|nr:Eco57I restriction-modification methylase domain-containing protein [ANME-2 cluster archaeon]
MDSQNAIRLLDDTFNNDFNTDRFSRFIKELFNEFNVTQRERHAWSEFKSHIDTYQLLGSYIESKKSIDVLAVKLKRTSSIDRARTKQRNFVAKYLSDNHKDAALVAFYGDDRQDWRFSFVKLDYHLERDESGNVKPVEDLTPAKRYSYLVGVNEPNHTCKRQFLDFIINEDTNPSIAKIEEAFSIDNVTKKFFSEYKELFWELKESLDKIIEKHSNVKEEFDNKSISTVDFSKKLLGQIVFIYFLQKKGWLGVGKDKETGKFKEWGDGPKKFLRKLFDKEIIGYDKFFNEILEPLFYEALSKEYDHNFYSRFDCKIPFLNGGLFEPINDYDWVNVKIPFENKIFEDILGTFDRFNFTVKEDEPLDKEVAVDPEMLGKVFENLLTVNDRKSKGAFYTPREIVHYMCQQSLINYLETNTDVPVSDIETFILHGELAQQISNKVDVEDKYIPTSIKINHKKINDLLKNIKIVDPAVGSGAFPMGMMNEIVKARSILSWLSEDNKPNYYDLKRETIENCLYGVDIDSSAVDITKLRFWLSLVVDESDIKKIKPLPNLDHRIMCGNSLLEEFEGVKLFDEQLLEVIPETSDFGLEQVNAEIEKLYTELGEIHTGKRKDNGRKKEIETELKKLERKRKAILTRPKDETQQSTFDSVLENRKKESQKKLAELKRLQKAFFNEQSRKRKKELAEDIDRIEWELVEETLKEQGNEGAMQKLAQYKKNKSKPFFLWKLYFSDVFQRENPGFDVVIANPPYVDSEEMVKKMPEQREQIASTYKTASGNWDLYIPFFELAFNISRNTATITFITPNKWLSMAYGKKLRELFMDYFTQLCNCDKIKVFEAGNTPEISFIKKTANDNDIIIHSFNEDYSLSKKGKILRSTLKIGNWGIILSENLILLIKILNNVKRVADYGDVENPFAVSEAYNLLSCLYDGKESDNNSDLKFINTGTIDKYVTLWGFKKTTYIKHKFLFPFVDKKEFKSIMPKRFEQSISRKIIITGIRHFECFIDINGEYVAGKSTIIIRESTNNKKLEPLLALLNSSIVSFYLKDAFSATGIDGGVNFSAPMVRDIPLPEISDEEIKILEEFANKIISITYSADYLDNLQKQSQVKTLENQIDQLVYKLYDLTPEETQIVEGFNEGK